MVVPGKAAPSGELARESGTPVGQKTKELRQHFVNI